MCLSPTIYLILGLIGLLKILDLGSLVLAWLADRRWGDPEHLPHPIVWFGKLIAQGEKHLNKGRHRLAKGAVFSLLLIAGTFVVGWLILLPVFFINYWWGILLYVTLSAIGAFYCLAGTTLISEVQKVFRAVNISTEQGRKQVARIVGRDTSQLDAQQIRTAALETLSENLSDGVVAPMFWFVLLGTPGMLAYKMINTLDSMIGYKSERYKHFGRWAAHIDDIANYLPARITAWLMIHTQKHRRAELKAFVKRYARNHASPNSGYPEAALAGILNCRFGGSNIYFGQEVHKPYIGKNNRLLSDDDMVKAVEINRKVEVRAIIYYTLITLTFTLFVAFLLSENKNVINFIINYL